MPSRRMALGQTGSRDRLDAMGPGLLPDRRLRHCGDGDLLHSLHPLLHGGGCIDVCDGGGVRFWTGRKLGRDHQYRRPLCRHGYRLYQHGRKPGKLTPGFHRRFDFYSTWVGSAFCGLRRRLFDCRVNVVFDRPSEEFLQRYRDAATHVRCYIGTRTCTMNFQPPFS